MPDDSDAKQKPKVTLIKRKKIDAAQAAAPPAASASETAQGEARTEKKRVVVIKRVSRKEPPAEKEPERKRLVVRATERAAPPAKKEPKKEPAPVEAPPVAPEEPVVSQPDRHPEWTRSGCLSMSHVACPAGILTRVDETP